MENKTIQFNTGNVVINEKYITFQSQNNLQINQGFERIYIGNINYEKYTYLRLSPFSYSSRFFFGGLFFTLLSVIGDFISSKSSYTFLFWLGAFVSSFGFFLFLINTFVDGILGTNIAQSIYEKICGIKTYKVSVQNTSGGDHLEFLINIEELDKATNLIVYKLMESKNNTELGSSIKELNELVTLKNNGAINNLEFEKLKKQLLNK